MYNVYDIFYSQLIHQIISAAIVAIFSLILLLLSRTQIYE